MRDFSTAVIGWLFILAALMLWFGWVLLPVHIGAFFESEGKKEGHIPFYLYLILILGSSARL